VEHDDIQATWRRYDRQLAATLRFNDLLVRQASLHGTQTALGRLGRTLWFELAADAFAVFLLGGFAADHAGDRGVLAASVALDVYAIAILGAVVAQLVALAKIDYDEPVLPIARAVDRLRLLRARVALWTLLVAPLMWPALAIVGLRAFAGADAVAFFGLPWVFANLAFGATVLAAGLFAARRYASGLPAASLLRRFFDTLSGNDARAAAQQLDTLVRYEASA
jgi:hypothetical protein